MTINHLNHLYISISRFQDAVEKMIMFKERMAYVTEPLQETARFLTSFIQEAFTNLTYTTPRESTYGQDGSMPETIFESKSVEMACNVALSLDITAAVSNLKVLSSQSTIEEFRLKFQEFDYTVFTDKMVEFVEQFENCTSYYSRFISSVVDFFSDAYSFARRNISFGDSFIFEKESQVSC